MPGASKSAEIAVAVAASERPVRLRWLLNALEDQTLDGSRFEVVVGHPPGRGDLAAVLSGHRLAPTGVPAGDREATPGALHNAAWRAAGADVVAFTTDGCRPDARWLERLLEAARRHPGAVIQGLTQPDPHERSLMLAPRARTLSVEPPDPAAEACNIAYPRELLERLGGFDHDLAAGQGADLALRAGRAGAALEAEPSAIVWHGVLPLGLRGALVTAARRRDLATVLKRHPELRRSFRAFPFVSRRHALLAPALAVGLLTRRPVPTVAAALPYAADAVRQQGQVRRPLDQRLLQVPGRGVEDAVGLAALAWGSLMRRTFLL